ncbi:MAG TPA: MBL fold metallo-hydrolase [archaeon]|nr:MBL fold metallo-hydrolase [archaeon]
MLFQQIAKKDTGCLTYVVGSQQSKECAVIDPLESEIPQYIAFTRDNGMKIKYVIDTHTHAEHASGARKLANMANAKLMLSHSSMAQFPFSPLRNGDELRMGEVSMKVLEAPGHTMDGIMLLVEGDMLLTGDTLLCGWCGRADFPMGISSVDSLFETVQKVKQMEADTLIYPAHYGPAHGLDSRMQSRIRDEFKTNELFLAKTKQEFKELAMKDLTPLSKKYMDTMRNNLERF